MSQSHFRLGAQLGIAAAIAVGCSSNTSRVYPPKYNPLAGSAALASFDTNNSGKLDKTELAQVPSLLSAIESIDSDQNGEISAAEIDARIKNWLDSKVGEMSVSCEVHLDGQPLADAEIVFEPESFLGSSVHPLMGKTASDGSAGMSMADEFLADKRYAGGACGFYKIRITHPSQSIPARYNTETTLGCEVAANADWVNHGAVVVKLTTQTK
jgi:hypothetical protein